MRPTPSGSLGHPAKPNVKCPAMPGRKAGEWGNRASSYGASGLFFEVTEVCCKWSVVCCKNVCRMTLILP